MHGNRTNPEHRCATQFAKRQKSLCLLASPSTGPRCTIGRDPRDVTAERLKLRETAPLVCHAKLPPSHHRVRVLIRSRGRVPMPRRGSPTCQGTLDSRQRPSFATRQPRRQRTPGDTQHPTGARRHLHLRSCGLSVVHARSSSERRSYRREVYVSIGIPCLRLLD